MKFVCLILISVIVTDVQAKSTGLIINILLGTLFSNTLDQVNDEVHQDDVTYYLYTRENPAEAIQLNANTLNRVNKRNPVKFIIHGWLESAARPWYRNMTDEYLRKGDYNIIQVDWSRPASRRYDISARDTEPVGRMVGSLIVNLYLNYGVPLSNFHIIGHSLGAHVSGSAGKEVTRLTSLKLPRISALDAASPLFEVPPLLLSESLSPTDATIVDAIHTDAGIFGYRNPVGTVDFYPNGGTSFQPGCSLLPGNLSRNIQDYLDNLFCSHTRSYIYFIRSINKRKYVGTKCNSWSSFKDRMCDNNFRALMGDDYTYTPEATGTFFLSTVRRN